MLSVKSRLITCGKQRSMGALDELLVIKEEIHPIFSIASKGDVTLKCSSTYTRDIKAKKDVCSRQGI